MRKDALFSPCGTYRYVLSRDWSDKKRKDMLLFVMLNPSTADAKNDDPTIRRCIDFAKREGYECMSVINLFAYRATDPKELTRDKNLHGPENVEVTTFMLAAADKVICAWGANATGVNLAEAWLARNKQFADKFYCLGRSKHGHPRHPLMLRKDSPLEKFGEG